MGKRQGDPTGRGGRWIEDGLKISTVQIAVLVFFKKIKNWFRFRMILLSG